MMCMRASPPAVRETERADHLLFNLQSRTGAVSESTSRVVHLGQNLEKHVVFACDACGWEHHPRHAPSDWIIL
jgi:hypothetical protein